MFKHTTNRVVYAVVDLNYLYKYFQSTDEFQKTNTLNFQWINISAEILHAKVA